MPNVGSQMGQGSGSMVMNPSVMASGPGMMPTPGMAQQPGGVNSMGMASNSGMNMPLTTQHNAASQSKYVKIWEVSFVIITLI